MEVCRGSELYDIFLMRMGGLERMGDGIFQRANGAIFLVMAMEE